MFRRYQYTPLTGPVLAETHLKWQPQYPDFGRDRVLPTSAAPTFFYTSSLPNLAIPDVSWQPSYPDFVKPKVTLSTAEQRAYFAPEQEPDVSELTTEWEPTYPILLIPKKDPTEFKTWYARPPNVDFFPVPALSWNPSYPDFTRSKPSVVEHPAFFAVFALPQFAIPNLSWSPDYPGFTRTLEHATALRTGTTPPEALSTFPIPDLSWAPSYPDFTRTIPSPFNNTFFFFVRLPSVAIIDLWQPGYGGGGVFKDTMIPSGMS